MPKQMIMLKLTAKGSGIRRRIIYELNAFGCEKIMMRWW